MQRFAFFIIHGLLFTIVKSHPLNEEIQSEPSKKELWSGDSAVECKLNYDRSSDDSNKIREDNQQTFNDWNNDRKQNFHKISEVEKDDSNSNEILFNKFEGEDDDSSQVLNEAKEKSLIDVHPSRYLRSITVNKNVIEVKEKSKKKKQKSKKKKQKSKDKINQKGTSGPQIERFDASELAKINTGIQELERDNSLTNFSKISSIINEATGLVPAKVIPVLIRLAASYSKTAKSVKFDFADINSVLTKFVIKSYRVMQRGMSVDDRNILKNFGSQLNNDMIQKLNEFVESTRSELMDIHKDILVNTHGERATNLLNTRDELEANLTRILEEVTRKSSEYGANQGKIEALSYEKQLFEKALEDSIGTKEEAQQEIKNLKSKIPEYEKQVQQHRDTHSEERGSFWIFSWKVRDIHVDNGEKIARENLNRLLQRISTLEAAVANWPDINLVNRVTKLTSELGIYKGKKSPLEHEYEQLNKSHEKTEKGFYAVIRELEGIYELIGTLNIKSIQIVDQLGRAVFSGQNSIVSAYALVQDYLQQIDVDKDLLVNSVLASVKFMNMADSYMGATRIQNIKHVLGLD